MKINALCVGILAGLGMQSVAMAQGPAGLEISGLLEVEFGQTSISGGDTSGDIGVATVELGISGQVNDELSAVVVLLHEEDDKSSQTLEADVATVTYQPTGAAWSITAGQTYLPFGSFASNMVSDPLTLEMGEIRESAVHLDVNSGALAASVYLFNGNDKSNKVGSDQVDNFGFNISYVHEGAVNLTASLSYINDLGNTNGMQESLGFGTSDEYVAATSFGLVLGSGDWSFIVEQLAANDAFETGEFDFNGAGAKPTASTLEVGYALVLAGKPAMLAAGQQTSTEAQALGLPETRTMVSLSIDVMDNSRLSFELKNDDDYSLADGGSGESSSSITAQLAVEF